MALPKKDKNGYYRVRWTDSTGKRRETTRKSYEEALEVYEQKISAKVTGKEIEPLKGRITVEKWCERWLSGYALNSPGTRKMGITHCKLIIEILGKRRVSELTPDDVRTLTSTLKQREFSDSYIYAVYRRMSQVMNAAIEENLIARNPCTRSVAPSQAKQRQYVATTDQVWELYDNMPMQCRSAVLLGAFAGLRIGEAAGLRREDIDLAEGIIRPYQQYGGLPLKTDTSRYPVPIPTQLTQLLQQDLELLPGWTHVVPGQLGRGISPSRIEWHFRKAREKVLGLPTDKFRFHDLRHYYASVLIHQGLDITTVQKRMRHESPTVTLKVYGHMFADKDTVTRDALASVMRR